LIKKYKTAEKIKHGLSNELILDDTFIRRYIGSKKRFQCFLQKCCER